jgi:hypothetical protein
MFHNGVNSVWQLFNSQPLVPTIGQFLSTVGLKSVPQIQVPPVISWLWLTLVVVYIVVIGTVWIRARHDETTRPAKIPPDYVGVAGSSLKISMNF